jgi:hypothetical protein
VERQSEMMASLMRAMDVKGPIGDRLHSKVRKRKSIDGDGDQFALGSDDEDPLGR